MKKNLTALMVLALSTSAFAGFQSNTQQTHGGFSNSSTKYTKQTTTVAKAKRAYDDTYVSLIGNITAKIGDEKYTFRDNTGTITVEIDDDKWGTLNVTPKTKVQLYGKVDKDNGRTEIDVKRIVRR